MTAHWKTEYTIIETVSQLREISMDGKYLLANNLNLGLYDWNPLGTEEAPFTGIFNGCGRSIYNLDISIENSKLSGLFGYNNGEIKNLTIKGAALEIVGETSPYIGTVAAINNGTISNCRFEGEVMADIETDFGTLRFGGLVACNNGTIQNSSCSATICIENSDSSVDYGYCGILVGENSGTISKCFTEKSAKFVSRQMRAGGICGFNNGGTIENCYSTARVLGIAYAYKDAISYVGGISGYSSGKISNCYMSGDVDAYSRLLWLDTWQYLRSFAGGICGVMEREATLEGCVSIGDVYSHSTDYGGTGVNYYGSIVALNMDGTARNCYSNKDQSLDGYSIGAASGTKVSKEELLTATFYKETLNWDTSAWKIKDGTYPTLH